jgi:hypothetical protein
MMALILRKQTGCSCFSNIPKWFSVYFYSLCLKVCPVSTFIESSVDEALLKAYCTIMFQVPSKNSFNRRCILHNKIPCSAYVSVCLYVAVCGVLHFTLVSCIPMKNTILDGCLLTPNSGNSRKLLTAINICVQIPPRPMQRHTSRWKSLTMDKWNVHPVPSAEIEFPLLYNIRIHKRK